MLKPVILPVWVSTVWDLDFTETEPLDPRIEEEITEDGLGAFSSLYQALTPFATGDDTSRGVRCSSYSNRGRRCPRRRQLLGLLLQSQQCL